MSELREQLHRAKDEYENLHYPGDLAADVLPATAGRIWPKIVTIAAVAIAAVVALAVWFNAPAHTPKQQMVVKTPPAAVHKTTPKTTPKATPKATPKNAAGVDTTTTTEEVETDFPDGLTVVPTLDSMGLSQLPSMPTIDMSMPSLDEMMSSSTATTQEAS
jgi:hypothetical protein